MFFLPAVFFFLSVCLSVYLFIYLREEEREKGRETLMQETLIGCLLYVPRPGTEPAA